MTENNEPQNQENQEEQNQREETKETQTPLIKEANEATANLKSENDRKELLLNREEEIAARNALGGRSEAGVQPKETKEETNAEYRERIEKEIQDGKFQ